MSLHTWIAFFITVFILSGTPGPNMLHILTTSVQHGFRQSLFSMAGCFTAVITVLIASAAGLSTLLMASPNLFNILRYLGVIYLVYLGIKAWCSKGGIAAHGQVVSSKHISPWQLFQHGLLVGYSNPKLILFAAAFLSQFINLNAPQLHQYIILISTFGVIELGWYFVYALGGYQLTHYLKKPAIIKAFNRITGGIFIGFGALLVSFKN